MKAHFIDMAESQSSRFIVSADYMSLFYDTHIFPPAPWHLVSPFNFLGAGSFLRSGLV